MEAIAKLRNVPTSPVKMRLVADIVRGKKVAHALNILKFEPKQGARKIEQVILSALANWQVKHEGQNIEDADLYVKTIFVDGGRMLKRIQPAPQGRAHRIQKRSNHITVIIDSLAPAATVAQEAEAN
jgi:large subunit ribosomal protein L22